MECKLHAQAKTMMPTSLFFGRQIASARYHVPRAWLCRSNIIDGDGVRSPVCMHSRLCVQAPDVSTQYCRWTHNRVIRMQE